MAADLPSAEQVQKPFNPARQARAVEHRTPVVVMWLGQWRPGEVLAWWKRESEWIAQVRMRYTGQSDQQPWLRYDPTMMLPVLLHEDDVDWWLPPATSKRDRTVGPGGT